MRPERWIALTALAALLGGTQPSAAHEGHSEAPGEGGAASAAQGPVYVSEAARENLGLRTAEAELRPVERTLTVIGEIRADPQRSATVSSRIAGRVSALLATEGERVRRGQPLVEVESFQIGDPPPRVRYAAPLEGTVVDRHVVVGDDVERNGHLFEIADLRELLAVGRVFEGEVGRVAVGQKVRVRVPSYSDEVFEGVVERLGGQLDPASRSLPVFVRVENAGEKLRPHMRATLSLVTERADLALAVPGSAVLGEFGDAFVFVQRDDEPSLFDRRAVVTGLSDDLYVEIVEGVLPGERVVVEGNYSLQYLPVVAEPATHGDEKAEPAAPPQRLAGGWPWAYGAVVLGASLAALVLGLLVLRGRAPGRRA